MTTDHDHPDAAAEQARPQLTDDDLADLLDRLDTRIAARTATATDRAAKILADAEARRRLVPEPAPADLPAGLDEHGNLTDDELAELRRTVDVRISGPGGSTVTERATRQALAELTRRRDAIGPLLERIAATEAREAEALAAHAANTEQLVDVVDKLAAVARAWRPLAVFLRQLAGAQPEPLSPLPSAPSTTARILAGSTLSAPTAYTLGQHAARVTDTLGLDG